MASTFQIAGDPDRLLETLFPIDGDGFIRFGFSAHSRTPGDRLDLLEGPVEFLDYLMEGFVTYLVSAEREADGIRLVVRKTGSNRDEHVDWFVRKYISSMGLEVTRGTP